jgi:peptidyl-prolyl cis-trans isomerase C
MRRRLGTCSALLLESVVFRVVPLVLLVCVTACSKGTPAQASTEAVAAPAGQPATAVPAAPGAAPTQAAPAPVPAKPFPAALPEVLAKVNGETISKGEFEQAVRNLERTFQQPVPPEQRDAFHRRVLDQLVGFKLILQEGTAKNVTVPDTEIDARIATMKQPFPSDEAFQAALKERGASLQQLRIDVRKDLVISKVVENAIGSKIAVSPAEISEFYEKNPTQFQQPDRVRASHILITVPKDADEPTKAKARARAEALLKEVKSGKDFAALAKQNSEDPGSAANGGDLGYFGKGQMVGPFNDVAFALQPGATSDVVETQFGFHIIKVVEKQAARTVPLDERDPQGQTMRARIEQFLQQQARQREAATFVNGLRAKSKVEIFV